MRRLFYKLFSVFVISLGTIVCAQHSNSSVLSTSDKQLSQSNGVNTISVDGFYSSTELAARADINMTPVNHKVSGNVLTNDITMDIDNPIVTHLIYKDSSGQENTDDITSSLTVTVYDEDNNEAGELEINADGNYIFTPKTDYDGRLEVKYNVEGIDSDTNHHTDQTSLTIQVLPNINYVRGNSLVSFDFYVNTIEETSSGSTNSVDISYTNRMIIPTGDTYSIDLLELNG